jgi:hypothetical protein
VCSGCSVIGPPYAITGIQPAEGPVTGNTQLFVRGIGFEEGQPATVRFTFGKKFVEATGVCVSSTMISVNSPGFEHVGPCESHRCIATAVFLKVGCISFRY